MACDYCYIANRLVVNGARTVGAEISPLQGGVSRIEDSTNPLFNFSSDFVRQYQSISSTDLALAVPYVSLASIDENGNVMQDFNLSFFSRGIDMNALASAGRFGDRPEMSLSEVRLSSDLSTGTLFLQSVNISLKLHKPSDKASIALVSVLYPGGVFRLKYGWSSPNNGNQFLGQKDIVFFQVVDYTIEFNIQGEAEISLNGMSMNDPLSLLVGDRGIDTPITNEDKVTAEQVDGVQAQKARRRKQAEYSAQNTSAGVNDVSIKQQMAKNLQAVNERACINIRKEFQRNWANLQRLKQRSSSLFPDSARRAQSGTAEGEYVLLHDLIRVLCGGTLDAIHGPYVPSNARFRFVYGAFNASCAGFANRTLADFPVHWKTFDAKISELKTQGIAVPTMRIILRILTDQFLNDPLYWKNHLTIDVDTLKLPRVRFSVSSHIVDRNSVLQFNLLDERKDIPNTQQLIASLGRQSVSDEEVERTVASNIPVLRVGHHSSYVREIRISQIDDAQMRTVFLNRALANSVSSPRLPATADTLMKSQKNQPLVLPLKGELQVVGHVEWRPMRFFYLRTGIYLLDGVYSVTRVEHTLDAGGFATSVSFMYQ